MQGLLVYNFPPKYAITARDTGIKLPLLKKDMKREIFDVVDLFKKQKVTGPVTFAEAKKKAEALWLDFGLQKGLFV